MDAATKKMTEGKSPLEIAILHHQMDEKNMHVMQSMVLQLLWKHGASFLVDPETLKKQLDVALAEISTKAKINFMLYGGGESGISRSTH